MLEIAGNTELGAEIVGAIPAVLQRYIHVYEREKEKDFTVFPKNALNPGIFLKSPGSLCSIWKLLKTLSDLKKKNFKKRYDYIIS